MSTIERAERIEEIVRSVLGPGLTALRVERLTGGASRETLRATAEVDGQARSLILRIDNSPGVGGVSLHVEAAAMRAAEAAGVPVAHVHAVGDGPSPGGAWMAMDLIAGETIARRILRDEEYAGARAALPRQIGGAVARIHAASTDCDSFTLVTDPIQTLVDSASDRYPFPPALALGLRWLRENPPEPAAPTLVHGDLRLGNLIVDQTGLAAVLDWELTRYGDPLEDLGWVCAKVWRFGSNPPLAGVGTREQLLDAYADVAGWRPTLEQVHWWELYATVRWGLMCMVQAERHLSGSEPSVELVSIGRRAAEQEFDTLLALGVLEPYPSDDILDGGRERGVGPYGVPTAADLVDGVLLHLRHGVIPLGGALGFEGRVAAHTLRIVQREILLGAEHSRSHSGRLAALGLADDAALARAIEDGSLDGRWDEVVEVVAASVRNRIEVANPSHTNRRW